MSESSQRPDASQTVAGTDRPVDAGAPALHQTPPPPQLASISEASDATATSVPPQASTPANAGGTWGMMRLVVVVILACTGLLFGARALFAHLPPISSLAAPFRHASAGGSASCYRTIDMSRLTALVVSDLLARTNGKNQSEAQALYHDQLRKMDAAVSAVADSCLLIRREAVVASPADVDVTAQIAGQLGLDWSRGQKMSAPDALPGTPAAAPASQPGATVSPSAPATPSARGPASESAGNPSLDD
ncbi:hypothetical protein LMG22037_05655 [Paraburkholderia phenoliruptrix]|uniref:Uncharacterized protein n=1 Tax=Paraburkholderia phenoliruptrix TaxID=252970 RepID=A0A6J5CA59_9BURK|nr:hypothetical protein [Paraburkholderia phenoliruptrix]CAB3731925.1 hypothetical protein LMG22037_05655 [Paraburkholderia phenoliruptrix]